MLHKFLFFDFANCGPEFNRIGGLVLLELSVDEGGGNIAYVLNVFHDLVVVRLSEVDQSLERFFLNFVIWDLDRSEDLVHDEFAELGVLKNWLGELCSAGEGLNGKQTNGGVLFLNALQECSHDLTHSWCGYELGVHIFTHIPQSHE